MDPSTTPKKIETKKSSQEPEKMSWWDKLLEGKKRARRCEIQRRVKMKALRGK